MQYGTIHPKYRLERIKENQVGEIDRIFDGVLDALNITRAYDVVMATLISSPSNITALLMDIVEAARASPDTEINTLVKLLSDWCPRCNGVGILFQFLHIHNGICFACLETGRNAFKDMNVETARKEFEERKDTYKGLYLAGVTDPLTRKPTAAPKVRKHHAAPLDEKGRAAQEGFLQKQDEVAPEPTLPPPGSLLPRQIRRRDS